MKAVDLEPCGRLFVGRAGFRQRAGEASRRRHLAVYCVEGESLTLAQLAKRLGVSETTARARLNRERAKPGPATWESLQS